MENPNNPTPEEDYKRLEQLTKEYDEIGAEQTRLKVRLEELGKESDEVIERLKKWQEIGSFVKELMKEENITIQEAVERIAKATKSLYGNKAR